MSSAYFAPLVTLPSIIVQPGRYRTRSGDIVTLDAVSIRHDFGCVGSYPNGVRDAWHKSGRLYATGECRNDIVGKSDEA